MGFWGKVGRPSAVTADNAENGPTVEFGSQTPGLVYDEPYELPLSRFPREIFDTIVSYLDQVDRLALSQTCKTIQALVGNALYSFVRLRGKAGLMKFATSVALSPNATDYVRSFWLVGDFCCSDAESDIGFDVERLSLLREFRFQPAHGINQCLSIMPILQKIASGSMIRSLKSFVLDLRYTHDTGLPQETTEQLLRIILSIFSIPSLDRITIFHHHRGTNDNYQVPLSNIQPHEPPIVPKTKFTNLRTLTFYWDALPLPFLSILLQLPANLESLTLTLSLLNDHNPNPAIPLDTALSPVTKTLKTLNLRTVDAYNGATPESTGLRFGPTGLTNLPALRHLSLPSVFLTEAHGFTGQTPWFPPSLTSLCLSDARVYPVPRREGVMLDPETARHLARICWMLDSVPELRLFVIPSWSCGHLPAYPTTVLVGETLRILVDRGIRVGIEVGGLVRVMEVRVDLE
ncbi:hypothetical protein BDW62DRAFT_159766 [Aspergillus aurantiobrunneus]